MHLQFKISTLIAINYSVALILARKIDAIFFLLMVQPVLIWICGRLLHYAVPRQVRLSARENYLRMDGTISQERRMVEVSAARVLKLRMYLLVGIVTLACNFAIVLMAALANLIPGSHHYLFFAALPIPGIAAFEFTRRCYLNLIRLHIDEIAGRHLEYVNRDMEAMQADEDHHALGLEYCAVAPAEKQLVG